MSTTGVRWFTNLDPALRRCWQPVGFRGGFGANPTKVTLLGEDWVVAELDGQLVAMLDRCPHRLAPLSEGRVVDGTLECAYHGWRFTAAGRCAEIPALGPMSALPSKAECATAWGVVERHGLVWVAIEPPVVPLPDLPELGAEGFTEIRLAASSWHASAAQICDNFLDVAHFPFLHTGTFGDGETKTVASYEVTTEGWTCVGSYPHLAKRTKPAPPDADPMTERVLDWTFTAPHWVHLRLTYPMEKVSQVLAYAMQPVDAGTTIVYTTILRNDINDEARLAWAANFETAVAAEDRGLLEKLVTKAVPLDLRAETHTRADRITVDMRRLLVALVDAASAPGQQRDPRFELV